MQLLKDKKIIIAIVVVILLLAGGGYYVMGMKTQQPVEQEVVEDEFAVEELSPEDIGLDFEFRNDGKAGRIVLKKPKDIKHVEYEMSYTYEKDVVSEDEAPEGVQGIIGEIDTGDLKGGIMQTEYREFGTCSAGKCRYDNVISPIKVTMKITKNNGKVYQTEKSFELPK